MANSRSTEGNKTGHGIGGQRGGNRNDNRGGKQDDSQSGTQVGNRSGGERGFAAMDAERQREIASMGGRAAHQQGTAHEFDSEEARAAGRRGGEAVSQNREHMAAIGAMGGRASRSNSNGRTGSPATSRTSDVDRQDASVDFRRDSELGKESEGPNDESVRQGSSSRH